MTEINWPLWQSGRELRAKNLRGLEDYLLARHHFEGNDWGVEKMASNSVQITVDDKDAKTNKTRVIVTEISGLTRSGKPVVVDSGYSIETTLDFELSSKDSLNVVLLLNETVDEPSASQVGIEDNSVLPLASKISIYAEVDSTIQHRQSLQTKANGLFLGTYERKGKGGETQLINKPRVRSLGVLDSFVDWRQWTQPLVTELAALLVQHSRPQTTAAGHLASQQLLTALYRWKHLSICEWTQLAGILRWAAQLQPHRWESQAYDNTASMTTETDEWHGDDFPKNVIALLQGLLEQKIDLGVELIEGEDYEYTEIRGADVIIKLSATLKGSYLCLGLSTLNGSDEANLPRLTQPDNDCFNPWEGKKVGKKPNNGYVFDEIKVDPQFEYVVTNVAANSTSEVKLFKQITTGTGEDSNV